MPLEKLFENSQESRRLPNFTVRDYGEANQLGELSYGNVPLGIYRPGKKYGADFRHDPNLEAELHQIYQELKVNGNFLASVRNFNEKICLNFNLADFQRGLLFITLTFNNRNGEMKFWRAP